MGIFDFLKNDDDKNGRKLKSEEPYSELSTGLDDFENPSWSQVESALEDVEVADDSFATLIFHNSGLEVDTVQCIMDDEGYIFEALPARESKNYGKIYHLGGLSYEFVLQRFEEFYNEQKVRGYKEFEQDSFDSETEE